VGWGGEVGAGGRGGDEGGGVRGIGGRMTFHLSPDVQHMCPKNPGTTQILLILGCGLLGGVFIVLEIDRAFRVRFWKTTRRVRARVCAKFERPRRFRGSNMNHKKKARRCLGLALDPCLDSSIPRFSNSLA
jgi:hypothetical protein